MSRFDLLGKDAAIEMIIRFIQSTEIAPIWSGWYVGITDDIDRRLYEEHRASYTKSTYVSVDSPATAINAESYLIERYGMDERPGGGEYPRFVYAFKKLRDTDPPS